MPPNYRHSSAGGTGVDSNAGFAHLRGPLNNQAIGMLSGLTLNLGLGAGTLGRHRDRLTAPERRNDLVPSSRIKVHPSSALQNAAIGGCHYRLV